MTTPSFIDAFAAMDEIFGELTQAEKIEERYYNILNDISIALVDYRTRHNLNQTQLSEQLGVAQSMISKYESGDYNFSIRALNELCGKLGFSLDIRVGGPEDGTHAEKTTVPDMDDQTTYDYTIAA